MELKTCDCYRGQKNIADEAVELVKKNSGLSLGRYLIKKQKCLKKNLNFYPYFIYLVLLVA